MTTSSRFIGTKKGGGHGKKKKTKKKGKSTGLYILDCSIDAPSGFGGRGREKMGKEKRENSSQSRKKRRGGAIPSPSTRGEKKNGVLSWVFGKLMKRRKGGKGEKLVASSSFFIFL